MKFSETVQNITKDEFLPRVVDFVNNSNVLTARVMSNTKKWTGPKVQSPTQTRNSTTGKSITDMEQFAVSNTDNVKNLKWEPATVVQSVVVSQLEKAVNQASDDNQVVRLVAQKLEEAQNSLANLIGTQLYGTGAGNDLDGLGLIVDNGTASTTYAGITRATLPSVNADVTAAANGLLTLGLMAKEFDAVSAAGSAKHSPTMILSDKATWSLYEELMGDKLSVQYNAMTARGYNRVSGGTPMGTSVPASELHGSAGFVSLDFRGKPCVADDKAPVGKMFFLNENYLEFRDLSIPGLERVKQKQEAIDSAISEDQPTWMQFRGFMNPTNQLAEIGAMVVSGNFICTQPRRQGVITGITKIR